MKRILKILIVFIFLIILVVTIIILNSNVTNDVSLAAGSSTSDIQLMARAINGEARGEPYE